ncbi:hypothetical protein GCM10017567_05720 [Amycolatopsis bullii]|uniref:Uncharacterized protein n=1 Tax=Amycolatopsis bullii TaxID=941987 RepID=A0ABQ3K3X5_9PSEU|nr:hypothetical protein GCM10017567_05720 [Amycolatopsis bullii]
MPVFGSATARLSAPEADGLPGHPRDAAHSRRRVCIDADRSPSHAGVDRLYLDNPFGLDEFTGFEALGKRCCQCCGPN